MPEIATTKRHRELNTHLSDILHQYLLAVDALHGNALADITDNLSLIQHATIECFRVQIDYKIKHGRGDKE